MLNIATPYGEISVINEPAYSFGSADNVRTYPFAKCLMPGARPISVHALNDERSARRQLPVNSFWPSGTGALAAASGLLPLSQREREQITIPRSLAQAVFADDWTAYAQAWAALDANEIAALLARQRAGETVRLTLCGERGANTFETSRQGFFAKIAGSLAANPLLAVLERL